MLRIENLTLERGNRTILKDINFTVNTREIYSIIGPNGAGKSSLAYTIMGCGNYRPNKGRIIFDGKDITDLPIWQRARLGITLAWQEPARFEGITVEDYLLLGIEKNRKEAEEALKRVLLEPREYLKRRVDKNLSGGERKRIELAAIFAMRPRLAILDEPDSGIDILVLDKIINFICDLKVRGTTVLLITHRPRMALAAERAALICGGGYLVKEGDSQEVVKCFKNKSFVCPRFRQER